MRDFGEWIGLERIPDVEQKNAAAPKNAMRFAHRCRFVRDKHETELANDRVERSIGKWERGCVGLLPIYIFALRELRFREFEHVGIQVRRHDFSRRRQGVPQTPRHNSGATSNFENASEFLAF